MELDFRAVCRNLIFVEFEQFVFGEEDDRLLHNLEFGLDGANLPFGSISFADSPVKEPAQVEVMLLDGLLFHLFVNAQETDEGIYAVIIEAVEGFSFDVVGKVAAECGPTLHRAGSPLAFDTLFLDKFIEIGNGRGSHGSVVLLLSFFGIWICVRIITVDDFLEFIP